jgi:ribonucleoside-diphosphate reductase alpha chain
MQMVFAGIPFSENACRVLEARYLQRDEQGRIIETPEQLFARVARAVAEAEARFGHPELVGRWEAQFYHMLASLDFLPNSPTLMNAPGGQLSACFVLPVDDCLESILEAVKHMALIQATGGGTGFSFSRLRPRGDRVASTGGEASGPVSFMKVFDCATEHIKQGGKRRGANIGILRVDHPDIMEFIGAKADGKTLNNFNLSVGVTDSFMRAVDERSAYPLIHPGTQRIVRSLPAADVFHAMVHAAWRSGDPGLLFLDAINRANPTPQLGAIEATNPCGEVPLLPFESCNLGSINLAHVIRSEGGATVIDWDKLRHLVQDAVRFLDNVIEVNSYLLPEIEDMTHGNRKLGLGVMGFAEMLIHLGVSYDSEPAIRFAEEIMSVIREAAYDASQRLADERGVFPNWNQSIYGKEGVKIRNATRTAVAPTGTISMIAGTTASIEPMFALAYRRRHILGDRTLSEVNPIFLAHICSYQGDPQPLIAEILRTGRLDDRSGSVDLKRRFVTALEIPPERHLQIQAAFQRHVENSVSKTINLPESASYEDVRETYRRAWQLGVKGVTVFRYGSKETQVLELGADENALYYDHASKCDPHECRV